jgi:hypothetical protein
VRCALVLQPTSIVIALSHKAEMQRVFIIAAAAVLAACAAKSSTAPAPAEIAGSWTGPVNDGIQGSGTLSFSLAQTGDSVTGTWSIAYANPAADISGLAAGDVNGSTISILLRPSNPPTCQYGPFEIAATVTGRSVISGSYSSVQCGSGDSGTFTASLVFTASTQ